MLTQLEQSGRARRHVDDLVGRAPERERIRALLAQAQAGRSGVLLARGTIGVGKTTLLADAAGLGEGMTVLRARGVESESELPFAGLHELVRPLVGRIDALAPAQAAALSSALGLGPPAALADRFTICAATLSLIAAAAEEAPILILVDDAQWLDSASAEAIAFAARRLDADRVAAVIALRHGSPSPLAAAGFDELLVEPLDRAESRELLSRAFAAEVTDEVVDWIWERALGNPLALLEFAGGLSSAQRAGLEPLEEQGRDPVSLERAILSRINTLAAPLELPLLVAALSENGDMGSILRVCAVLGVDATLLEEAERARVLTIADGTLAFRHPLIRSAITRDAHPARRRRVHAAFADVLSGDHAAREQRAWHRASAALATDEEIACELDETAALALRRSGYAAAERAFVRAAALSESDEARARRFCEAGAAAALAGRRSCAVAWLDRALRLTGDDHRRAEAHLLRARIVSRSGSATDAYEELVREAGRIEAVAADRASLLLSEAVLPCLRAGRPRDASALARRARELAPHEDRLADVLSLLMLGTALIFTGEVAEGSERVREAAERDEASNCLHDQPQLRAYLGAGLRFAGDHARAGTVLRALVADSRAASAPGILVYALIRLAGLDLELGRWQTASAALHEAARLAGEIGLDSDRGMALGALAWLAAAQGREDECRDRAGEALVLARELGVGATLDFAGSSLGLLELGLGNAAEAAAQLEPVVELDRREGWCDAAVPPYHTPDLIEALLRLEREDDARALVESFSWDAGQTGREQARAVAARCRGLVAPADAYDEQFETALALAGRDSNPFERARTQLCYGERLRRDGRRVESRSQLRAALATFEQLKASPWADRAAVELRASGQTLRRREAAATDELTPHELQVALVVAQGASNREAAARLFLSPKTVEFHLGRIYRKLGVTSRLELARHFADFDPGGLAPDR
ncbi:MAG TPA: AAA family ATPase [Gaiellaceae bacterium]